VHHDGILAGFRLSREQVEKMILDARVKAGWIEEAALEEAEETEETEEDAVPEEGASAGEAPASGAGA
jgi:transcription termination/antitermination protein NusA